MSSIPAGAVINYIRIRMYVGITARQKNYARVQNANDSGTEYLREYRSGTYTTSTVSTSRISSITLTFRADTTVYVDFSDFYAIVDYEIPYSASRVNGPTAEAGSTITFTVTNSKLSELNHKLKLTFGIESYTITMSRGVATGSYTIPETWLQQMTDKSLAYGTVVCETYSGSTKVGTSSASFGVSAPDSAVPTVTLTLVQTGDSRPAGWGMYLQTFSGVDMRANVETKQLATVASIVFSEGTKDLSDEYLCHIPTLTQSGVRELSVTVTDSRGKSTTASASITVEPYSSPAFNTTRIARCDSSGTETNPDGTPLETGTYVNAFADVLYSGCNTHNTISIAVDVEVGLIWVPVGDLPNGVQATFAAPPTSDFPSGFDPATVYRFRIKAVDALGKEVSRVLYLQSISMLMHFRDSEDGMAVGMVSRRAGFEVNPAWPAYFYGTELLNLIIPEGIVLQLDSAKNPNTIYAGTTWTQLSTDGSVTTWKRTV